MDIAQITPTTSFVVSILSALFALIGILLTIVTIRRNNQARQLEMLRGVFTDILALEKELYDRYASSSEDQKKKWDSLLFNSIEFFAFLVNNKYVSDVKMIGFFRDAIVGWYEGIFLSHHSQKDISDENLYPEMRRLYKRMKDSAESARYSFTNRPMDGLVE